MPMQQGTSSLAQRLGQRATQAWAQSKGAEVKYGNPQLPGGIEGGVARINAVEIKEYATGDLKGQLMFQADAIVLSPKEHKGQKVAGLRTKIGPHPLCDTPNRGSENAPKTFEEHYHWMSNEVAKLLGVKDLGVPELAPDRIEMTLAALRQAKPMILFRTWSGRKQEIENRGGKFFVGARGPYGSHDAAAKANPYAGQEPLVNHEWNGRFEGTVETDAGVQDDTARDNGQIVAPPPAAKVQRMTPPPPAPVEETPAEPEGMQEDLDGLAAAADGQGDEVAMARLKELALAAGWAESAVDGADNWAAVVGMIQDDQPAPPETEQPEGDAPTAEEPVPDPAKGDICKVPFRDPKTKRTRKVNAEIIAVDKRKRTVQVKDLATKKPLKDLFPWDAIIWEED